MHHFLNFLENEVQIVALTFLLVAYIVRLFWLFKYSSRVERTFPAGNARKGILLSMMRIAKPRSMESTKRKPFVYVQFVVFHIGVLAAITATFIIPYWPDLFTVRVVVRIFQIVLALAFVVGMIKLYNRLFDRTLRTISTPDDYFSLIMMIVFFAFAFISIPIHAENNEWPLIIFFALTAFLLVYVPFSKIGHYLYYPFTHFFIGRTFGHRGVYKNKHSLN